MGFRFRIGPFTFGSTGVRLSVWRSGSGVSIPISGKGGSFGKLRVGPVSLYVNDKKKDEAWKGQPATERQKKYANDLGIKYPKNVTKAQMSELISKALKKKPSDPL